MDVRGPHAALGGTDPQIKRQGVGTCGGPAKSQGRGQQKLSEGQRLKANVGDCLIMVLVGSCASREGGSALSEGTI